MDTKETEITIPQLPKDGWIKINSGVEGFYQVQYQDELFTALKNNISNMPVRDRIQIQADLFAASKAGLAKSTQFLEVISLKIVDKLSNLFFFYLLKNYQKSLLNKLTAILKILAYARLHWGNGVQCLE